MTKYGIKNLDHLGLVSGFCKEIGLAEFVDDYLPLQSKHKHISYGQLLLAMILNGLGFTGRTLHMYPDYFSDKPLERLIAAGIDSNHINDDALGRCLDKLYEHDVSKLYQLISEEVVTYLGLSCSALNLDSTSFHVDGDYVVGDDFQGVRLTKGYSRDHRPELNQVVLNLITENQAGLPVYMQACSGNSNDSESFKKLIKSHISSLKAAQHCQYLIGDASLYVAQTIQTLSEQKQYFVTRVPQRLNEAKVVLAQADELEFTELDNGYAGAWLTADYGDVPQKWLLVRSTQANKREQLNLNKRISKSSLESIKSFKRLCRQQYRCHEDANKALFAWKARHDYIDVADAEITSHETHGGRGRPKSGISGKLHYQITGVLYCCLDKKKNAEKNLGLFILATNDCSDTLDMQDCLTHYKSQQSVERGFRFLKSPDFLVSSFFLKKPERIESLLMVMTCCLMIYAALEHKIREQLQKTKTHFPDMKKKPAQNPTARWVFYCFQRIHELKVDDSKIIIVNLKDKHQIILNCLGHQYLKIYS